MLIPSQLDGRQSSVRQSKQFLIAHRVGLHLFERMPGLSEISLQSLSFFVLHNSWNALLQS